MRLWLCNTKRSNLKTALLPGTFDALYQHRNSFRLHQLFNTVQRGKVSFHSHSFPIEWTDFSSLRYIPFLFPTSMLAASGEHYRNFFFSVVFSLNSFLKRYERRFALNIFRTKREKNEMFFFVLFKLKIQSNTRCVRFFLSAIQLKMRRYEFENKKKRADIAATMTQIHGWSSQYVYKAKEAVLVCMLNVDTIRYYWL